MKGWWKVPGSLERLDIVIGVLASLFLSFLAVVSDPVLNRDGMFYIELSQEIARTGTLSSGFDWPFYLYLLAFFMKISPFGPVETAQLMNAGFAALATVSLYLLLNRASVGKAKWFALLFALSFPGFNEYRSLLIREWPAWAFALISIFSYSRYMECRQPIWALTFFLTVFLASLFRLEMLVVAVSLFFMSFFSERERLGSWLFFWGGPAVLALLAFLCAAIFVNGVVDRFLKYLSAFDLRAVYVDFSEYGDLISNEILNRFSDDYGAQIFFVGLLSIIPVEIISVFGGLLVAMVWARRIPDFPDRKIYVWLFSFFLAVLVFFLVNYLFITTRYAVWLALFLSPIVYFWWLAAYMSEKPVARNLAVSFLLLLAVASAYSSSGHEKYAIIEAGKWLAESEAKSCYINDGQLSFYAGQGYFDKPEKLELKSLAAGCVAAFVINKDDFQGFLAVNDRKFTLMKTFESGGDDVVVVLRKTRLKGEAASGSL